MDYSPEECYKFVKLAERQFEKFGGHPVGMWNSWIHTFNAFKAFIEEHREKGD